MWVIIVVCVTCGFVCQPVDRLINKKVSSKWLSVLAEFVVYFIIFMALYGIADLLGFSL